MCVYMCMFLAININKLVRELWNFPVNLSTFNNLCLCLSATVGTFL